MTKMFLAVMIGASLGYAYYRLVGCSSGSCPITSNPWSSAGYGALIGLVLSFPPLGSKPYEPNPDTRAVDVTEASFQQEVVDSDTPVVVYFWAPWCGPCKTMSPYLDELAQTYEGRVKVARVNIDLEGRLSNDHKVRRIPSVAVYSRQTKVGPLKTSPRRGWLRGLFEDLAGQNDGSLVDIGKPQPPVGSNPV